jgi:histidinol phosphatase-like enzyme
MIIYVDVDETICTHPPSSGARDYKLAKPILKNINKINNLYDLGHQIVYWTARGSTTGQDWTDLTTRQLKDWKAKYHQLRFGKPNYDIFICDKAINSRNFFIMEEL